MFKISLIMICVILESFALPLGTETMDESVPKSGSRVRRSHIKVQQHYRWPNKTIPYRINMTYYTKEHAEQIDKALKSFANVTCLRFVERTDELDFVTFSGDSGSCNSHVGHIGGEQFIWLHNSTIGNNCFKISSIHHEVLHTLGFHHVHKGTDRDEHLRIIWENVIPSKMKKLLKRTDASKLTDFGVGYDYDSVLHYDDKSFSKNGEVTMETLDPKYQKRIGQRAGLSAGDILKVRTMYNCDEDS